MSSDPITVNDIAGREYQAGKNQDPVLALSGWWLMNAQDRAALETLGKLA